MDCVLTLMLYVFSINVASFILFSWKKSNRNKTNALKYINRNRIALINNEEVKICQLEWWEGGKIENVLFRVEHGNKCLRSLIYETYSHKMSDKSPGN